MCDFGAQLHTASAVSLLSTDDIIGRYKPLSHEYAGRQVQHSDQLLGQRTVSAFFPCKKPLKTIVFIILFFFSPPNSAMGLQKKNKTQNKHQKGNQTTETNLCCSSEGVVSMANAKAINCFKLPKPSPSQ